ncbi:MAG: SpoIIE family protein phosphatase [Clostridia bacterium]|nr:SpoIIE family protein phosphatase [Clostridia bacterium]
MKKYKNIVIGGIETRLFNLILATLALVTAAFFAVSLYQSNMLSKLTTETGQRQRASISEITGQVMDRVVEDSMDRITEIDAQLADATFRDLKARVTLLVDLAARLFDDPSGVRQAPWSGPDPGLDGQLSAQVLLAGGVDASSPELAERLGLVANMSDVMISVCRAFGTDNAYIALPEGATLAVNKVSGSWLRSDGTALSFDARTRFWYRQAVAAGELVFTDVEADQATGALCVTCAAPVYGRDGRLCAVVGSDLFLDQMTESVRQSDSGGGYLAVVNGSGHTVLSPRQTGTFQVRSSGEAEDLRASENAALAQLVTDALKGRTGVRRVALEEGGCYMIGAPLETLGWALIAVFDEAAAAQPVAQLEGRYAEIEAEAMGVYREKSGYSKTTIAVLLSVLFIVACAAAVALGKRIVRPLNTITQHISQLSEEAPEFHMEDAYRTGDEIEVLAEAFESISRRTILYVEQVKRVTAEKERIGTELRMANLIQESMLPNIFPAFPDRPEFDIYATMEPAKEVGGDFYDFFLIDDDHLCLVMADVSGKGVPAALFMMIAKVILQSCAMLGKSVGEILEKTNEALCSKNHVQMFVTIWLGILEISTGRLIEANAGHEYPALMRAGGSFELFRDKHGFVIGGLPNLRFKEQVIQLNPGDKLFVYTDGVPEAADAEGEMFGTGRMLDALNEVCSEPPTEVLRGVHRAIEAFVQDSEAFDDMTMLCLEYKGLGAAARDFSARGLEIPDKS